MQQAFADRFTQPVEVERKPARFYTYQTSIYRNESSVMQRDPGEKAGSPVQETLRHFVKAAFPQST